MQSMIEQQDDDMEDFQPVSTKILIRVYFVVVNSKNNLKYQNIYIPSVIANDPLSQVARAAFWG